MGNPISRQILRSAGLHVLLFLEHRKHTSSRCSSHFLSCFVSIFHPARCSGRRAPAKTCYRGSIRIWIHRHHPLPGPVAQISQRKKATHARVSRLSHFVIPPFPIMRYGVGKTFLPHPFSRGRGQYTIRDPEDIQGGVSFSHISQLPS